MPITNHIDHKVRFTTAPCFLGHLLIAASDRGICAVEFADDHDRSIDALTQHFPGTRPTQDPDLQPLLQTVIQHIEHPNHPHDLPLDIQGTPFQQQVWSALEQIPPGQTRTYTNIAHQIDRPTAARAVGQACAANKIAVLIPCHRAVPANNHPTTYRWGLARKQALLNHEASNDGFD